MSSDSKVVLPELPDHIDAAVLKIAGVVVIGAIMSILDITVVNVALPTFQTVFGSVAHPLAYSTVAWSVTAYTLALATVIPLTGWAADRFGTKRLYMTAIALFVSGSVLCATLVEHRRPDRVPGPPGPRRRHADAARHDDHDPGRGTPPDGPADGHPRGPDAARPDPRPDHRRLAHPGRELALDLPDQRADRRDRDRLRLACAAQGHPGTLGVLRLPRHGADVTRAGAVPVRRLLHPVRRHGHRPAGLGLDAGRHGADGRSSSSTRSAPSIRCSTCGCSRTAT